MIRDVDDVVTIISTSLFNSLYGHPNQLATTGALHALACHVINFYRVNTRMAYNVGIMVEGHCRVS